MYRIALAFHVNGRPVAPQAYPLARLLDVLREELHLTGTKEGCGEGECGGAQCGICTPGMVMAALSLLERHPDPTEAQIREGLAGNLCRCTGYVKIIEAVELAAERMP